MAKLNDEKMQETLQPHLNPGETLRHWAIGVKQPNIGLMLLLFLLGILPGVIAMIMLTKNYLVGLTDGRLVVLQIKSISNAQVKEVSEYTIEQLRSMDVKTSTGVLFTHIKVKDPEKPFAAKFHRAFSKNNRPNAMAIAEAISPAGA